MAWKMVKTVMAPSILLVSAEPSLQASIKSALQEKAYELRSTESGENALEMLSQMEADLLLLDLALPELNAEQLLTQARKLRPHLKTIALSSYDSPNAALAALRYQVCDLLPTSASATELYESVGVALSTTCACAGIEVISATPSRIELVIPCDLGTVQPLYHLFFHLELALPIETREAIAVAVRELLQNAIEHGGHCDPTQRVTVSYARFERLILCSIKDPGGGFELDALGHAAVSNPSDDPCYHLAVRHERGLRPGGFGLLLVHQLVDEMVYNDRRNEVMFVKYL